MLPLRFMGGSGASLAAAGSAAYIEPPTQSFRPALQRLAQPGAEADMTERPHLKPFRGAIVGAQGGLISAGYVVGPVLGGLADSLPSFQLKRA